MSALVRLFIFFLLGFVLLGHFFSLTFINSTKSKSKFHGKIVTLYFLLNYIINAARQRRLFLLVFSLSDLIRADSWFPNDVAEEGREIETLAQTDFAVFFWGWDQGKKNREEEEDYKEQRHC